MSTPKTDPKLALEACRLLLASRADAPENVDRDQLNAAVNWARAALGIEPVFRHGN